MPAEHFPRVSILICTHNRADDLRQTVEALGTLEVPPDLPTELLIIDNGSTDATARIARGACLPNMTVRPIQEPRKGKSRAFNTGLAAAAGEIILCTDDDVRPPHNWIAGMCAPILTGRCDAVAGGVDIAPHLQRPWFELDHRARLAVPEGLDPADADRMIGANMAFSTRVLKSVPAFDPELGPGALGLYEDSLFAWQVKKAGYKILGALDIAVEHHFDPDRLTRESFLASARIHGRCRAYLAHHWEHREIPDARRLWLRSLLKLAYYRARRRHFRPSPEGAPVWEINQIQEMHYYRHFLVERSRPRNYTKEGLVRLNAV